MDLRDDGEGTTTGTTDDPPGGRAAGMPAAHQGVALGHDADQHGHGHGQEDGHEHVPPPTREHEKRGANVEVYGFVGWIASGLTFGTPAPSPSTAGDVVHSPWGLDALCWAPGATTL